MEPTSLAGKIFYCIVGFAVICTVGGYINLLVSAYGFGVSGSLLNDVVETLPDNFKWIKTNLVTIPVYVYVAWICFVVFMLCCFSCCSQEPNHDSYRDYCIDVCSAPSFLVCIVLDRIISYHP